MCLPRLMGCRLCNFLEKVRLPKKISFWFFKELEKAGIPVHLIGAGKDDNSHIVKVLKMIPLEVVVRFRAYGSYLRRHPQAKEMEVLDPPVLEFFHKVDNDPLILEGDILRRELCTKEHLDKVKHLAIKSAEHVKKLVDHKVYLVDIKLEFGLDNNGSVILGDEISPDNFRCKRYKVDIKLEFGLDNNGSVILGDEISPDNFRCWRHKDDKIVSLDKDVFREAPEDMHPDEIRKRVKDAYSTFAGEHLGVAAHES